jgi:hypothetical protein
LARHATGLVRIGRRPCRQAVLPKRGNDAKIQPSLVPEKGYDSANPKNDNDSDRANLGDPVGFLTWALRAIADRLRLSSQECSFLPPRVCSKV